MSTTKRKAMERELCHWARSLPVDIGLASLNNHQSRQNFQARQLHLPYLTSLIILCRSSKRSGTASLTAAVAASLSARSFEDFLARDETRYLAPVHTRFCLISCMALVALMPHARWWAGAGPDLKALQQTLTELSKRWGAAVGASKMLATIIEQRTRVIVETAPSEILDRNEMERLFEGIDLNHCRMWQCLKDSDAATSTFAPNRTLHRTAAHLGDMVLDPGLSLEDQTTLGLDQIDFGQIDDWILDDRFML